MVKNFFYQNNGKVLNTLYLSYKTFGASPLSTDEIRENVIMEGLLEDSDDLPGANRKKDTSEYAN